MVTVVLVVHSSTWKVRLLVACVRLCVLSGRTALNIVTFHLFYAVSTSRIEEILRGRLTLSFLKHFRPFATRCHCIDC